MTANDYLQIGLYLVVLLLLIKPVGSYMALVFAESPNGVLRAGELADSSMIARRVALLEQVTCASPAYLERHGDPESIEALAGIHAENPGRTDHRAVNYVSPATGRALPLEFTTPEGIVNVTLPGPVAVNGAELYTAGSLAGPPERMSLLASPSR